MKKSIILFSVIASLIFSSCSGISNKKGMSEDEAELLNDALDSAEINVEHIEEVEPLEIEKGDPFTEMTRSIYDFGDNNEDLTFSIIDQNDAEMSPYASNSNIYIDEDDVSFYDQYGRNYSFKSFQEGYGKSNIIVPTSEFDEDTVYYVELNNEDLAFKGKDPSIRRLTFYTLKQAENEVVPNVRDVDIKDNITTLDSTKVYYYDTDGYSPFFVYSEMVDLDPNVSNEAGMTFRIRHPSIDTDDRDTVYGVFMSMQKNPNGAGYMVRYEPAKAENVYDNLAINASKTIDETDEIECLINDEEEGQALAQHILHHPNMVTSMYGVMNAFDVKPKDYKADIIDWGSRIDIKFGTSYNPSTDTFNFTVSAAYTFYPKENLTITLKLAYSQTMKYDVTASVSIETEFIFPVGVDYTLKVVEDNQKEVTFSVIVQTDNAGEYDEEKVKQSVQKAILDAFKSDFKKKSVFSGDGGTDTAAGASYPIFSISCTYFFPIEIKFAIQFYWEFVPSIEVLVKYTSHTQTVDLCVANEKGTDPSSQSASDTNKTLSFSIIGKTHAEIGLKVSLGIGLVGFYKFFHAEVYLKVYGALDIQGYFVAEISWSDNEPVFGSVSLGAKFEISVGLKVGVDIYLLFGGYKHDWPVVGVPLIGLQCGDPLEAFTHDSEDIYITNEDYDSTKKQFNHTLGERHLLTSRYLNTSSFNVDVKDMEYDASIKTKYGSWVQETNKKVFATESITYESGTSNLAMKDDGHIGLEDIAGQDNFDATINIKVNDVAAGHGVDPITKQIKVHFVNNDRQDVYVDGQYIGGFVAGAQVKLPVPQHRKYYKFTGYKYTNFSQMIMYDEDHPENFIYIVNTEDYQESGGKRRNLTSMWVDDYKWEVYFMDGLNNIISMVMVENGGTVTPPEAEARDRYMIANPPDENHHYEFIGWDRDLDNITGNTVIRALYTIVAN